MKSVTNMRFVLSFQYENVYAVRDKNSLEFLKDIVENI